VSFHGWGTLSLALSLLGVFFFWRIFAGRTVQPTRRFMRFFLLGMVGAGLGSLLCQRIATIWIDVGTVSWSVGPVIEEVLKATPIAILVLVLGDAVRLSIGDVVMAGVATGLGFEFLEGNFAVLSHGQASGWQETFWPLAHPFGLSGDFAYFVGHGVTVGLVALAAIVGLRLWGRAVAWVCTIGALALVTFTHVMFNWKSVKSEQFFGELQSVAKSSTAVERLYDVTLQGRLPFYLLLVGLVIGVTLEGRQCARAIKGRRDLVLDDEAARPVTAIEWAVALQRVPAGRRVVTETMAFFRERRALALAFVHEGTDSARPYREGLDQHLVHQLAELDVPSDGRWLPPRAMAGRMALRFSRRTALALVASAATVLFFSVAITTLGKWVDQVYSAALAVVLVALGAVFAGRRLQVFLRRPHPDRMQADGSALTGHHVQALSLGCSALSSAIGVIALFGSKAVVAGGAFVTQAASEWVSLGGRIATVAGVGAMLTSSAPDPPDPCQGLIDETEAADAEIASLDQQAKAAYENAASLYTQAVAGGAQPDALVSMVPDAQGMSLASAPKLDHSLPEWRPEPYTVPAASGDGGRAAPSTGDDSILVMPDGTRLKVPLRTNPPRSFGTTKGASSTARTPMTPEQLVEQLTADPTTKAR